MAAFTVFANPDAGSQEAIPFLLDIQNELLSGLDTRVVVPLYAKAATKAPPISRLTPLLAFRGRTLVAMVPELAGVSKRHLGQPVGTLAGARAEVVAALDLLITGF